jgi:Protein of unknown function (DUF433)
MAVSRCIQRCDSKGWRRSTRARDRPGGRALPKRFAILLRPLTFLQAGRRHSRRHRCSTPQALVGQPTGATAPTRRTAGHRANPIAIKTEHGPTTLSTHCWLERKHGGCKHARKCKPSRLAGIGVRISNGGDMAGTTAALHSDPEILGGTPVFQGTRVPFRNLIDYLKRGYSVEEFLDASPR